MLPEYRMCILERVNRVQLERQVLEIKGSGSAGVGHF